MKKLTLRDLYPSFAHLIWETVLIEGGSVLAMADRTKINDGTLWKWLRRRTKHPEEAMLRKLVRTYPDLGDIGGVIELIQGDALKEITGKPIPAPDLSGVSPGPKALPPKRRRASRALGWVVAALGATAMGWGPTPVQANFAALGSEPTAALRDSVKYRRRRHGAYTTRWGRSVPHPPGFPLLTSCAA